MSLRYFAPYSISPHKATSRDQLDSHPDSFPVYPSYLYDGPYDTLNFGDHEDVSFDAGPVLFSTMQDIAPSQGPLWSGSLLASSLSGGLAAQSMPLLASICSMPDMSLPYAPCFPIGGQSLSGIDVESEVGQKILPQSYYNYSIYMDLVSNSQPLSVKDV